MNTVLAPTVPGRGVRRARYDGNQCHRGNNGPKCDRVCFETMRGIDKVRWVS
jgi:hypothetical protein